MNAKRLSATTLLLLFHLGLVGCGNQMAEEKERVMKKTAEEAMEAAKEAMKDADKAEELVEKGHLKEAEEAAKSSKEKADEASKKANKADAAVFESQKAKSPTGVIVDAIQQAGEVGKAGGKAIKDTLETIPALPDIEVGPRGVKITQQK